MRFGYHRSVENAISLARPVESVAMNVDARRMRSGRWAAGPPPLPRARKWTVPACVGLLVLALATTGCDAPDEGLGHGEASKSDTYAPTPREITAHNAEAQAAPDKVTTAQESISRGDVPEATQACWNCHEETVRAYLGHAMASSAGPIDADTTIPDAVVMQPATGTKYEVLTARDGTTYLDATRHDGGRRRQQIVGRIGAGRFDVSWATAEVNEATGEVLGRLFFAPVELVTGRGWTLSPFELAEPAAGIDFALTSDCLGCHVGRDLSALPGAAATETANGRVLFPPNHLGFDAFDHLNGLRCEVCHGNTRRHRALMAGLEEPASEGGAARIDTGLTRIGDLPPATQRDICGRCHLQGDARLELIHGPTDRSRPLVAQVPVLVPANPSDDFRFVSQLERLVLSECFRQTPEMTCTTCHDPHRGVTTQGIANFDRVCQKCHGGLHQETSEDRERGGTTCNRPADLEVATVTGDPARTADSCVDCHVRRSQPFDLPHVRSTDHWIRRSIPLPEDDIPHRAVAEPGGDLVIFDQHRLPENESTRQWLRGIQAIGLATLGRTDEALTLFKTLPAPGTFAATQAPEDVPIVEPLQRQAIYHETRALTLLAARRPTEARAAFDDALKIHPTWPSARLARAQLALTQGDPTTALRDTQLIIDTFPQTEQPWLIRLTMAEQARHPDLARAALLAIVEKWPSNASHWYKLGLIERQQGNLEASQKALDNARHIQPSWAEDSGLE